MTLQTLQDHEARTLRYFGDDYRRKSLEQLVHSYVTGQRVLDLRCLTGHLAVELALEGREVVALDGYAEGAAMTNALARRRGLGRDIARVWDLAHLIAAVDGQHFDTVLCLDTLNHVTDDEAAVAAIAQVLSGGGRLILSAPAFPALHGKRDEALGHLRRYTKSRLSRLLEHGGFQIQMMRYWNFAALPAYVLIEKLLRRKLPEGLRYGRSKLFGSLPNHVLRWWYTTVENRLLFPCGLTWFVIAHRRAT